MGSVPSAGGTCPPRPAAAPAAAALAAPVAQQHPLQSQGWLMRQLQPTLQRPRLQACSSHPQGHQRHRHHAPVCQRRVEVAAAAQA